MNLRKIFTLNILIVLIQMSIAQNFVGQSESVYKLKPSDSEAFYFTPENYNIKLDGKMDVSDELQKAINQVKAERNFGILFIPEGKYKISKTIYVPGAIRLIGYGKNRPEIILAKNSPAFQSENKDFSNYMIWFTGGIVEVGQEPRDAGAGTFYSAVSNIDFRIEDGNPNAIALRTHFAQHGFVSHSVINAGKGKAGLFDVGNEMEDVEFRGGDYGIITNRTSPGWPMMMVDIYFEGQRKAAIQTNDAGLTIVNSHFKNVPIVVDMVKDRADRLFMENCLFENIQKAGIVVSVEENSMNQLNLLNINCKNTPTLVEYLQSGKKVQLSYPMYNVIDFAYGLIMDSISANSEYKTISKIEPLKAINLKLMRDIPALPAMSSWVNIKDLGAKGDGKTDDTKVFQDAIAKYKNIYVPQGWYHLTGTIKMSNGTKLIGLHPFATQFIINESEPAFSGFGSPVALVESSEGGDDILNGIGLNTGAYNYRAVGCKWMAGEKSLMNDVKFVGGHGTMRKPTGEANNSYARNRGGKEISSPDRPVYARGQDLAWDNQYWSLWITKNGGGTFKDIWSANTYAANGLYVSNTTTPGRIYAMSLEHHVRNEARFSNVSNWKMYAFQFEEEGSEGKDCLMADISGCNNLMFVNQWMYRTMRVYTPKPIAVRVYNSKNIEFRNMHNYTQKLQVCEFPVYEMNKKLPAYPWDFAKLSITGNEPAKHTIENEKWKIEKLETDLLFGTGLTTDSRGNVYFCEHERKRIYKLSAEDNSLSLLTDYPWKPFSLATDTKDNLLVIFRYDPQPGYLINGEQEKVSVLADDNPMYSGWGNSGWAAWGYSINLQDPDETIAPLKRIPSKEIKTIQKAFYPSSRWRSDFDEAVVYIPENSFVAPDGVTIIPETYDLGRSVALSEAIPGKPLYVSKEINKTTVRLDVAQDGKLSNAQTLFPRGEYSTATDADGNLYVADGQIFVYDKNYNEIKRLSLEERPISIVMGGKNKETLFVTTHDSLYKIRIK